MSSYALLSIFNAIPCYILAALTSWAYTDLLMLSTMFCYIGLLHSRCSGYCSELWCLAPFTLFSEAF